MASSLRSLRRCSLTVRVLALLAVLVLAAGPTSAQTLAEDIDTILTEADWNGVALVATPEGVAFERGYGLADVASAEPNTLQTRFLIGSLTKQFTGALTLMLMEEGLLDLHVPLDTYLPDYPQPQGSQITLHHLLTHTSGIPNYTDFPDFETEVVPFAHTPAELVALFADLPLEFEPGSAWNYSNSGYALIGYIVEAVTGMTYAEALQDRLVEAFELSSTGYPEPDYEGIATGYDVESDGTFNLAPYIHPSAAYSAGALYSTVGDLYRWDQLLYGDTVFDDPATKALLFEEHADGPGPFFYSYGWYVGLINITQVPEPAYVVGHDGAISGFRSHFDRFVEDGNTIVLFTNAVSGPIQVVQSIRTALFTVPTVDTEPGLGVTADVTLAAPYPNPVSGHTTLTYRLAEPSDVRLTVYDVLGREVTVLAKGAHPAGEHEAVFDAEKLRSGLYVVRLTAGGETATRRLTVVR